MANEINVKALFKKEREGRGDRERKERKETKNLGAIKRLE